MDMKPVTSSNIESIGHDPDTNMLAVQFKNGGLYHYHDVDADKHKALISAPSIGKHLYANIRGKHEHSKVDTK
jgi:hypothetical protein